MRLPKAGTAFEAVTQLTQADFDEFARLSGDDNPIHVDPAFAADTMFGRTVAHGMMLFGLLTAATSRWTDGPVAVWDQELMFPAPTFSDETIALQLVADREVADRAFTVSQRIVRADGEMTAVGTAVIGDPARPGSEPEVSPAHAGTAFRGLTPGMAATRQRRFGTDDVAAFCRLVDDPNPRFAGSAAVVPEAMLGGTVSELLGIELPGRGTGWLKQRFRFHRDVPVDATVETRVEITRLRPRKTLVDLATSCRAGGELAVSGHALVLARHVTPR